MDKRFIIDANIFITAYKVHYPIEVFPSFWDTLKVLAEGQQFISINAIKDELEKGNDELFQWIKDNLPKKFFQPKDVAIDAYEEVVNFVDLRDNGFNWSEASIYNFYGVDEADPWIIAYAMQAGNCAIVTYEVSQPKSMKVKLPDVAAHFGVECISIVEAFKRAGIQF